MKRLFLEKVWKRLVTKPCFVGEGFTRKPPKFERFIRPMVKRNENNELTIKYVLGTSIY
jgi:ribosome biogenesis protein NSA2